MTSLRYCGHGQVQAWLLQRLLVTCCTGADISGLVAAEENVLEKDSKGRRSEGVETTGTTYVCRTAITELLFLWFCP